MQEWIKTTLGTYATINMGQSPESKYYNDEMIGLPFLQGNRTFGKRYPTIDTWTIKTTKIAHAGDVIMSVRAPVGDINITKQELCIGRGICSLSSRDPDNLFLYYLLKFNASNLINNETGSVFGSVNKDIIGSMQISLPDSQTRMKIGNILNTIDCCIELNSRINDYLAKIMALKYQALYNFESYDNSQMVESEFGPIPINWSIKTVSSFSSGMKNGATPSRNNPDYWGEGTIPWITTTEVHDNIIIDTKEKITEAGLNNSSTKILPINTVIMALYGKGTASRLALLKIEATTNQACCAMITDSGNKASFLYQTLLNMREYIDSLTSGSVQQNLSKEIVANLKFVSPPDDVIERTNLGLLSEMMYTNTMQSSTLQQLRDVLLPKLMSGEIDVSNLDLGS